MEHTAHKPQATLPILTDENLETLNDALRRDPEALAEVVSRAGPDDGRTDGWTPFARRLSPRALRSELGELPCDRFRAPSLRTLRTFAASNIRRDRQDV